MILSELRHSFGKLIIPTLCIAVAVGSRSMVGYFSAQVQGALSTEARAMAGGDLEISAARVFEPDWLAQAQELMPRGTRHAEVREFISMARDPLTSQTRLVEVRAFAAGFPFYGELEIDPPQRLADLNAAASSARMLAQPELLAQLGVAPGGKVQLGKTEFTLSGVVHKEPGPAGSAFSLGPRVWIGLERLAATGLAGFGSRVRVRHVYAFSPPLSDAKLTELKDALEEALPDSSLRVRTYRESNSQLRNLYTRLTDFLSLLGVFVFLLSGVGVMSAIRAHVRSRVHTVAVLRCLGASSRQVLRIFLTQALILGAVGSTLGLIFGAALTRAIPSLLSGLIQLPGAPPTRLVLLNLGAAFALGIAATLLFSLISLIELPSIRPLRLLGGGREEKIGAPGRMLAAVVLATFAFFAASAAHEARSLLTGISVVGGTFAFGALVYGVFYAAFTGLSKTAGAESSRLPFALRYGFRNLVRTRSQSALTLSVLGLGTLLLFSVAFLRQGMLSEFETTAHERRPELFLIDIGNEQRAPLDALVHRVSPPTELTWSKLIQAKLVSVNGDPNGRKGDNENRSREFNLSERAALYPTESLVKGEFGAKPKTAGAIAASLEESFAERMQLRLGDRLEFELQGVPFTAEVTSFRRVKWTSFQPNFFILLSPGALEDAPFSWIASLSTGGGGGAAGSAAADSGVKTELQRRLAREFPTVTAIDIDEASRKFLEIVARLDSVIRFIFAFTWAAGLGVLGLVALENAESRARESALLKVLGGGRAVLLQSLGTELGVLAVLSTGSGILGAIALSLGFFGPRFGVNPPVLSLPLALTGLSLIALLVAVGMLSSLRVFRVKPLLILKSE